ncbi:MAG: hypothetical protein K2M62_05270, partial [Muribaculaceae bacterium]|nr:hypothetical protein [Muribaculaceae bacterium]
RSACMASVSNNTIRRIFYLCVGLDPRRGTPSGYPTPYQSAKLINFTESHIQFAAKNEYPHKTPGNKVKRRLSQACALATTNLQIYH